MTFTINKEYSKLTIKASTNSAKTSSKLTKTSQRDDRHCRGIPVIKFGQVPHAIQCFLNKNLCAELTFQLILKNVRKNKKVYTKCKSEKIPQVDSSPRNRSLNGASC